MFIAQKLKKSNICEYILYMWQIEDIIRALDLNIDTINTHIIKAHQIDNEPDVKRLYEWYESLIDMLRTEDKLQVGHLQMNMNVLQDVNEFHNQLINSSKQPDYNAKFIHVLPFINQLRSKSDAGLSDVELCFNFQYGIMLLRMKKAEIKPETLVAQQEISKFMVLLNRYFMQFQDGLLDFED